MGHCGTICFLGGSMLDLVHSYGAILAGLRCGVRGCGVRGLWTCYFRLEGVLDRAR